MAGLLNKPTEEFLPDLKGLIFRNPQTNEWETDDQYLSGNVREKLAVADAAAVTDPRFSENVEALTAEPANFRLCKGIYLEPRPIAYCERDIPNWNTISISGYHIREAGATAAQELAFTLADGLAYVEGCLERGMDVDTFAPRRRCPMLRGGPGTLLWSVIRC